MFKYFTLEQVYEYAERMGYEREDVEIKVRTDFDWNTEEWYLVGYEVSFGQEYTEVWTWTFEDLEESATGYDHLVWED